MRSLASLAMLATLLIAPPGCGECTFEETISGVVTDRGGQPLEGVSVEVCHGERCRVGPDDGPCVSTSTDAMGRFTIEVPMCRPRAAECELRPLLVDVAGCEPLTVQPDRGREATITLRCGP